MKQKKVVLGRFGWWWRGFGQIIKSRNILVRVALILDAFQVFLVDQGLDLFLDENNGRFEATFQLVKDLGKEILMV